MNEFEQIVKDLKSVVERFIALKKCNEKCKECPLHKRSGFKDDICNVLQQCGVYIHTWD